MIEHHKPVRRTTQSEAAERLALRLAVLPVFARDDQPNIAYSAIREICDLLDAGLSQFREHGESFASVVTPSDLVNVRGKLSLPAVAHLLNAIPTVAEIACAR